DANGQVQVKAVPSKAVPFGQVALTAHIPPNSPEGLEPGLEQTSFYDPSNFCFPFGAHACVVEVDADTGKVKLLRYVAVDDVGNVINPMIVDGMVHGGIAQGVGQALWEGAVYDGDSAQLVTGSMIGYAMRTAAELTRYETTMYPDAFEHHSPTSVRDALGLLGRLGDDAKLLAGGHSLIPMMKLRLAQPKHVIDLRKVPGLTGIKEDGGTIVIGGMTTHWQMESSPLLKSKCPILAETAAMIGDPAVRNLGTIGGYL